MLITSILASWIAGGEATADTAKAPDPDSLRRVSYFFPMVEIVGANASMGAFNNYVRRQPYAEIDGGTIWRNMTHEWVWDDNNFEVNQIGHPVQGGMYYSIARANGHGYFGGLAYATLGSLQWEYFMETEPPALNDLVTTRMGGTMLGEASWRLSEYLSGESTGETVGWARRAGAYLVNPVFGVDRMLNGTPKRRSSPLPAWFPSGSVRTVPSARRCSETSSIGPTTPPGFWSSIRQGSESTIKSGLPTMFRSRQGSFLRRRRIQDREIHRLPENWRNFLGWGGV